MLGSRSLCVRGSSGRARRVLVVSAAGTFLESTAGVGCFGVRCPARELVRFGRFGVCGVRSSEGVPIGFGRAAGACDSDRRWLLRQPMAGGSGTGVGAASAVSRGACALGHTGRLRSFGGCGRGWARRDASAARRVAKPGARRTASAVRGVWREPRDSDRFDVRSRVANGCVDRFGGRCGCCSETDAGSFNVTRVTAPETACGYAGGGRLWRA